MECPLSSRVLVASILLSLLLTVEQAHCFSIGSTDHRHQQVWLGGTLFSNPEESLALRIDRGHHNAKEEKEEQTKTRRTTLGTQTPNEASTSPSLPPVIQQIADERQEFQIHLGRAMDTLQRDLPDILRKQPDFSIYHSDIALIDPSGVQLTGLDKYKSALQFLQTFVQFWFSSSSSSSGVQYRMVYDFCRSSIRVSWHFRLVPKFVGRPVFVDGISLYKLDDRPSGQYKIMQHKVEKLVINNTPVTPPYGFFSLLLQHEGAMAQPVPVGLATAVQALD